MTMINTHHAVSVCGLAAALATSPPQRADAAETTIFDGLYVKTPVQSLFYPNGDCTRDSYWIAEDHGFRLDQQLWNAGVLRVDNDGRGRAARVRFAGVASGPGFYGYLGGYKFEIDVKHVILAAPATPCP